MKSTRSGGSRGAWLALSFAALAMWGCSGSMQPDVPAIEGYMPPRNIEVAPAPEKKTGDEAVAKETPKAVSLGECVKIAMARNPLNEAARQGVVSAQEAKGIAEAPFYPNASVGADYRRYKTHISLPSTLSALAPPGISIPSEIGPLNNYGLNVSGNWTLFDSGERRANLIAAKAKVGEASEEAASIRQDIVLNVHEAYYGHTAALAAEVVAMENLARAEDHQRLAQQRKDVGTAVEADVMRSRVSVANAKLGVVDAQNLVRVTRGNLNTAMGLPVETKFDVARDPGPVESPDKTNLDEALVRAVHSRSELKGALQKIAGARSEVDAARSAFGPKVVAQGQYGRRDDKFFPQDDDWYIGAAIQWPIFTGFSRVHGLALAKSELSREEAQTRALVLKVRQEVWTAHSEVVKSYEAIEAAQALVKDAQESMRLTKDRYDAGMNTMTDLLDSQTALARAELSMVRAQWDYYTSKSRFERSTGGLATEEKR